MCPNKIIPYLWFCIFGTDIFLYFEIRGFAICTNCVSIYLRVLQIVDNDVVSAFYGKHILQQVLKSISKFACFPKEQMGHNQIVMSGNRSITNIPLYHIYLIRLHISNRFQFSLIAWIYNSIHACFRETGNDCGQTGLAASSIQNMTDIRNRKVRQ